MANQPLIIMNCKNLSRQYKAVLLLLLFILSSVINACKKDNLRQSFQGGQPTAATLQYNIAQVTAENRIDPAEISLWITRTLPADLAAQVHFSSAQQNVFNHKHVIRINISPEAYLYFTKEKGQLKAWIYNWHDESKEHRNFTGKLLSYSFQDGKLYALVYQNGATTKWENWKAAYHL